MRKQITTGSLSNEQIFHVIQLTIDDLPLILQLQTKVENALVSNTILSPLSRKEFTRILTGKGFILGMFIGATVAQT